MQLEWQLLTSLAAQTKQDERIAWLNDKLAQKSAQLEAEANAKEAAGRAGPEPRKHVDNQ